MSRFQFPRWRQIAMQAGMWGILGLTLALAALVNHRTRQAMRVELSEVKTYRGVSLQLPSGWQISTPAAHEPNVLLRAIEPGPGDRGRILTLIRQRNSKPLTPMEFLITSGQLALSPDLKELSAESEAYLSLQQIEIAEHPGVLVAAQSLREIKPGQHLLYKELLAAAISPSRHAILLKLQGPGEPDFADLEVLKQLASTIRLSDQPPVGQPGETVALEHGIRVTAPDDFEPVYETDPNLIERRLLLRDGFATIDLAPCALIAEAGDVSAAITTILATRDPELRNASVVATGERWWKIEPASTSHGELFPTHGFLIAEKPAEQSSPGAPGPRRALLAIFHGDASAAGQLAPAIESIAQSVQFVGDHQLESMISTGNQEARRLGGLTMSRLLEPPSAQQWWLWLDEAEHANVGWSHVAWDRRPMSGRRDTLIRDAQGTLTRLSEQWDGDSSGYRNRIEAARPGVEGSLLRQQVVMEQGQLRTEFSAAHRKLAAWQRGVPQNFVPGAWLRLIIGRLPPKPMILRTDALFAAENLAPPEPMTLIITHDQPATRPVDDRALRCINVQINGSGEISRWLVNEEGQVERIELSGGLQQVRNDERTVKFTFSHDPQLSP